MVYALDLDVDPIALTWKAIVTERLTMRLFTAACAVVSIARR